MAHVKVMGDSKWPEVERINGYAALLGCVSMSVRGLGFLVLTWTTVVLLGGFVSMLDKKDFWCLTIITFVQIARVVDVGTAERLWTLGYSGGGVSSVGQVFTRHRMGDAKDLSMVLCFIRLVKQLIGLIAWIVQGVVFCIACFLSFVALYMSGLLITTGLSLWRLTQHGHGNLDGDPNKANMKPALDALYFLVVVQGVIVIYKVILMSVREKIVHEVAKKYGFEGQAVKIVSAYSKEVQRGCHKDPSFAKGKNLITYAVDLMLANKSSGECCSTCGKLKREYCSVTRMLGTFVGPFSPEQSDKFDGQRRLIKQLIGSPSSIHILQKLLKMLNSSHRAYDRETKDYAARIVALVSGEMQLEQFPQMIHHTSSLIGTFEEYHKPPFCSNTDIPKEEDYKERLLHGLHILKVLAAVDENNCRVISDTQGLLPKIMAPLTSDLIHQTDHCAWSDVVKGSLEVMLELTAAPGKTGAKLRQEISINNEAISTMLRILKCRKCQELNKLTLGILQTLCMDIKNRKEFIMLLVDAFALSKEYGIDSALAGKALARVSFQGSNAANIILHPNGVVNGLVVQLKYFDTSDFIYSISAAEILQNLCIHYTENDEHLKELKKAMTDVMPKVLSKILIREATQTGTDRGFSPPNEDIEDQHSDAPQDNGHNKSSTSCQESQEQHNYRNSQAALISLSVSVCDTFISEDQDLALHFDAIDASSLPWKLTEMVVRNSDPTASCLRMLKVTSRMVISMVKHRGSYPKQDLDSLVKALFTASRSMLLVDGSTVFASKDDGATMKPARTLTSYVKEAQELVGNYRSEELEIMVPSTSISGES